jgi:hypothetical protein
LIAFVRSWEARGRKADGMRHENEGYCHENGSQTPARHKRLLVNTTKG